MPALFRREIFGAKLLGKSGYILVSKADHKYRHGSLLFFYYFSVRQLAKHQLKEAFVKAHLGSWVKKPIEQDMFEVDI